MGRRVHDQHRLGRHLEQQAVAFLGVADALVFALHRLRLLGQAELRRSERTQVAPDGEHPPLGSEAQRAVAHGNIGAAFDRVIDLPPARRLRRPGLAHQVFDLRAAFQSDNVGPALADPVAIDGLGEFRVGKGDVEHEAGRVQRQGDIRRGGDERAAGRGVQGAQGLIGPGEPPSWSGIALGLDHGQLARLTILVYSHVCVETITNVRALAKRA